MAADTRNAMKSCQKSRNWSRAIDLFYGAASAHTERDVIVLGNMAIGTCRGRWEVALQLFDFLGLAADRFSFGAALHAVGSSSWRSSLALLAEMQRRTMEKSVICHNSAMSACGKAQQWQLALQIFVDLGCEATAVSLNTAINACKSSSQWPLALSLLDGSDVSDVVSFNAALGCVAASDAPWRQVLHLLEMMKVRGIKADVITYATAVSALRGEDLWEQALGLLQVAGDEVDAFTYSAAISALDASHWPLALQLLRTAQDRHHGTVAVQNAAMNLLRQAHQWASALTLFAAMRQAAPGAENHPNEVTFGTAIACAGEMKKWQRTLTLLEESFRLSLRNQQLLGLAVTAVVATTQWQRALALAMEQQADVVAFNSIISACAAASLWPEALELFVFLETSGRADEISYSSAIKACEEGQFWELALHFLDILEERRMEVDVISYSSCISACDKGAQWQSALLLLKRMPMRTLQVDAISQSAAVSACEKSSEWEQSLLLLSEFSEECDLILLNSVLSSCSKKLQWRVTLKLLQHAKDLGLETDEITLDVAIAACAGMVQWRSALFLQSGTRW